jgi:hypothetical protein
MSRQSFTKTVERLFQENGVAEEVLDYFVKNYKSARVSARETERAEAIRSAIVQVLQDNTELMDRNQIGQKLDSLVDAAFMRNEKGHIAYNAITSYANQLVAEGVLQRAEVRERKAKRVKYSLAK